MKEIICFNCNTSWYFSKPTYFIDPNKIIEPKEGFFLEGCPYCYTDFQWRKNIEK